MKVFISWSGELSHQIALAFRDWLPSVIQAIEPYVSSEDIDKGVRWSTDISTELDESFYGILCVTQDNVDAPWLNFEAGALSKSMDKSRVSPFLFGVKRAEVRGPILQFQSTTNTKEDVRKLVHSLNRACSAQKLEASRLDYSFDVWWPELQKRLDALSQVTIAAESEGAVDVHSGSTEHILEELLELARSQQKRLASPESLLPRHYLTTVVQESYARSRTQDGISPNAIDDLIDSWSGLTREVVALQGVSSAADDVLRRQLASFTSQLKAFINELRGDRQTFVTFVAIENQLLRKFVEMEQTTSESTPHTGLDEGCPDGLVDGKT